MNSYATVASILANIQLMKVPESGSSAEPPDGLNNTHTFGLGRRAPRSPSRLASHDRNIDNRIGRSCSTSGKQECQ